MTSNEKDYFAVKLADGGQYVCLDHVQADVELEGSDKVLVEQCGIRSVVTMADVGPQDDVLGKVIGVWRAV